MKFKWTVSIEVDEVWVADGFNLTADRLHDMVQSDLGFATEGEIVCTIVKAPKPEAIAKVQGD